MIPFLTQTPQLQDPPHSIEEAITRPIKTMERITEFLIEKGGQISWALLTAIFILVVGFWLSKKIKNLIDRRMIALNIDVSIRLFAIPIINILLKTIVIIFVINRLGLNVSAFIAALGGVGLAIGLALQGSLANFAGGILIILFKPFKVGDYIVSQNNEGTVDSISILYTILHTVKGQVITLPNASVFNNPIINYSIREFRRLDIEVGISYDDDFDLAKKVLINVLDSHTLVDQNQAKTVEILKFSDSSVDLAVRCYVKNSDYWTAYWEIHRNVKYALDQNNISIPYPHTQMILPNTSPNPINPKD